MRVIGGELRGRRLVRPDGSIRPSTDRLREALFNALGDSLRGALWLEPFAGSGAVGIEAYSRGASRVLLNDRSRRAVRLIRENLSRCGIEGGIEVEQSDAFTFLRRREGTVADFVFLDPPYGFPRYAPLLAQLKRFGLVSPGSLVILEIFKKTPLSFLAGWRLKKTLKAGDSHLLLLGPADEGAAAE